MRNDDPRIHPLVTPLVERQRAARISAAEMARRLGISEANWCHARRGRRGLTAAAVARALDLYPELASESLEAVS